MFFKKRKEPEIKKFLKQKAFDVYNNKDSKKFSILFLKMLILILRKPVFGKNKKEKKKLDNDITSFELICYSLARIALYLDNKHKDRKFLPRMERYQKQAHGEKVRNLDFISITIKILSDLYKDILNWNVSNKIENRLKFYLSNHNDPLITHHYLYLIVYNSVEQTEPIRDIKFANFILTDEENMIFFATNLLEFENNSLLYVYEFIDDYLMSNEEMGFEIKKEWEI